MRRPSLKALVFYVFLVILSQPILAQTGHTLPLVMSASNRVQEGLVRIINHSERAGTVDIVAIDDAGERFGPVTLSLDALEAVNFDAVDLEEGNTEVNLSGGVGDGEGNWHLELDTALDIEALAYIRSTDGFLNTVHDVVADDGSLRYYVPTFNPSYRSLLRLVNQADADTDVTITGRDGEGGPAPEGEVRLTLPPYAACTVTALELESGDISSDCPTAVSGRFGNGTRKWRLLISADHPLQVLSLLKSSTGEQLANLSASTRDPSGFRAERKPTLEGIGGFSLSSSSGTRIINGEVIRQNISTLSFNDWGYRAKQGSETLFDVFLRGARTVTNGVLSDSVKLLVSGTQSDSTPTDGSNVWVGNLRAVDTSTRPGTPVHGEIRLEVDLSAARVDISTGSRTRSWQNVQIVNGGFQAADGTVNGAFYGDDHESVAATFEIDQHRGVFGALRE